MANMCRTTIAFTGEQNAVEKFKDILEISREKGENKTYEFKGLKPHPKFYDSKWLSLVLAEVGIPYKKISNYSSFILDIDYCFDSTKGPHIILQLTEKWSPKTKLFDLISDEFDLDYAYIAEEPGFEYFINTDSERIFFKQNYYIDDSVFRECFENDDYSIFDDAEDENNNLNFPPSEEIINVFKSFEKEDINGFNYPSISSLKYIIDAVEKNNLFNVKSCQTEEEFLERFNIFFSPYSIEIFKYKD